LVQPGITAASRPCALNSIDIQRKKFREYIIPREEMLFSLELLSYPGNHLFVVKALEYLKRGPQMGASGSPVALLVVHDPALEMGICEIVRQIKFFENIDAVREALGGF
jgi:hypothetical protein